MLEQRKKMSGSYIVLILVVVVALFFIWSFNQRASMPNLSQNDLEEEMKLRATYAVKSAKNDYDIILDYSPESVELIEEILSKIHNQHQREPYSDTQLTKEALKWGAYLGEVIKIQKSAEWKPDSEVGGPGSLPLYYGKNSASFPVRWCYKRIINGEEDNVFHKYMYVMNQFDEKIIEISPEE